MNLKQLIEQATPLPWVNLGGGHVVKRLSPIFVADCHGDESNAALTTHAVNMLPKLVEALECLLIRANALDQSATASGLNNCEALAKVRAVLAEANNPEVPK